MAAPNSDGMVALTLYADHPGVETHLVVTAGERKTITSETDYLLRNVYAMADFVLQARRPRRGSENGSMRWTNSADDILETIAEYCQRITGSGALAR